MSTHMRLIEWSFVMGALSWLFVRLWTDSPSHAGARRRSTPEAREPDHRASNPVSGRNDARVRPSRAAP
jgi:hypothetical protein